MLLELNDVVGSIAPRQSGGFILALSGNEGGFSFASLEVDSGKLTQIAALENEPPNNRFNDGKCDPAGRFIAGTMDLYEKDPTGSLYSFDGKSITRLRSNVTISNGMGWSPDHKTFDCIDTPTREIRAFDYDLATGAITEIGPAGFRRLIRALSLIYGIESYVVLKDIWGASNRQVESLARWMADALIVAALADARPQGLGRETIRALRAPNASPRGTKSRSQTKERHR